MTNAMDLNTIPTSAPIDTDSAGRLGDVAKHAVIRIFCPDLQTVGTGFLHKSGKIITADHVVRGSRSPMFVTAGGTLAPVTVLATDQDHDLALLKPSSGISAQPLQIAGSSDPKIGTQVSTWGFPAGYDGLMPLLSVGYLSGVQAFKMPSSTIVKKWVVNAAFNGGNSGGPLIHIETGEVFGVVSSKLAPLSQDVAAIMGVLDGQKFGMQYTVTQPDGSTINFSEAQLVGRVLAELRQQVQLVIGQAVLRDDLIAFLKANNIDP